MKQFQIQSTKNETLKKALQDRIDNKTKPLGSLGKLEEMALKIGLIQNTEHPQLYNPHILVFAGDHGVAKERVSAYPPEVTPQMVMNFVGGGAAINVFSRQHDIQLKIIDAGVNFDFGKNPDITSSKVGFGTQNFLNGPAMTPEELEQCFDEGQNLIEQIADTGCNIVGFGEMGIGNTSSAAVIMSLLLNLPIEDCAGRGTGLDNKQYLHKIDILKRAITGYSNSDGNVPEILRHFGGFEIAMMTAAMLSAAENKMIILVDGFIASSAFLIAYKIKPQILDYSFFCHLSQEQGHQKMLDTFAARPLLDLNLRLGEGTGCALAFPLLESAVLFLNQMASFESAGVSNKT